MKNLFNKMAVLEQTHSPFIIVTVVKVSGSAPQKPGAKMIIQQSGAITGTIGGGSIEHKVIEMKNDFFKMEQPEIIHFNLLKDAAMQCGGQMDILVEPFFNKIGLLIFGAGHTSIALCRLASIIGFNVTVYDDRKEWANIDNFPDAEKIVVATYEELQDNIAKYHADYIVSLTRGHIYDLTVATAVLKQNFKYFGIIGSKKKSAELKRKLLENGFDSAKVDAIHSPIGINIGSVTPDEIALSILAEIVAIKRKKQ